MTWADAPLRWRDLTRTGRMAVVMTLALAVILSVALADTVRPLPDPTPCQNASAQAVETGRCLP